VILNTIDTDTKYDYDRYWILLIPILNTINTDHFVFNYYAIFLRLRRECRIQSLLKSNRNLDQFLSKSDAIWPCSDQFNVLSFDVLGWMFDHVVWRCLNMFLDDVWPCFSNTNTNTMFDLCVRRRFLKTCQFPIQKIP
jgi:hypothetical protein